MRILCAGLLMIGWGTLANADTLLSVTASAGAQDCQNVNTSSSAACSVSSTVSVPSGQFESPASAQGQLSFGKSGYADIVFLGPQSLSALDYSLSGNWSLAEGIGLSGQAAVSLTAVLNLPANSGNWTFYGATYDATDDAGGGLGPVQVVTSNGNGWISPGLPSTFTIAHQPGEPFSVSIEVSDSLAEAQSSNNFSLELRMVDPVATPEPGTGVVLLGLLTLFLLFKLRLLHQRS